LYLDAFSYTGSGTTWTADVGSDATLVNTPTYTSPSPTYFSFAPASSEKATVTNLGNLGIWTVEAWFRVTSSLSTSVTAVVCNEFDLVNKLNFSMGTNRSPVSQNICMGFFDGTWRTTNGFSPTLNTWYHCVGTYDGSTIIQYVDGVVNTQLSYSGNPQSGGEVRIASRWESQISPTDFFPGDIGLVRIWDTALSAAEVTALYNENVDRFSLTPTITSFTTVETTSWTAPTGVSRVAYLVVGGGGGAGNGYDNAGGGGGGGGMVLTGNLDVTAGQNYTVTVGDGGIGGADTRTNNPGLPGENSVFDTITALGGGQGLGSRTGGTAGAAQISTTTAPTGGSGSGGGFGGKGGGGANGAGSNNSGASGGTGGAGVSSSITGSAITYGAGGAGGGAGSPTTNGANGTANRGNGGQGGKSGSNDSASGGNGGTGVVIIKYGS
jgi:hypothetical protein